MKKGWRLYWKRLLLWALLTAGAVVVVNKLAVPLLTEFFEALASDDDQADVRNIGIVLVGLFGGVFAIWRGLIAEKQTLVARQQFERSQDRDYADLFTKAVEQLGTTREIRSRNDKGEEVYTYKPNIEVRLGAIYALERISQDSERDHIAVMETLCAYVRENAPVDECEAFPVTLLSDHKNDPLRMTMDWGKVQDWWRDIFGSALHTWIGTLDAPRADVQAAVTVLGRRRAERIRHEVGENVSKPRYRLDLRRANLRKADLREGNFRNALLSGAHMEGADLIRARMEGAKLNGIR